MLELKNIHKYYNPGTVNEMCLFKEFNLEVQKENLYRWWEATVPEKRRC